MCKELGVKPEYIIDYIYDMNLNGPISSDYIKPIADKILDDIVLDLYETADHEYWNNDDLRLAFGRALVKRLKIEI